MVLLVSAANILGRSKTNPTYILSENKNFISKLLFRGPQKPEKENILHKKKNFYRSTFPWI